jgi:cytochrome b561
MQTATSWNPAAKFFHWLIALLIFIQIGLGFSAVSWPLSPTKLNLFFWHKSIGVTVLLLVALRLLWRFSTSVPALPADMPAWERHAAHASHFLLYVAMAGLPVSGWVLSSASGVPFRVFGEIPLPAIVAADKETAEFAKHVHHAFVFLLVPLLIVHVGAALRHHYVRHDDVLRQMLPFQGKSQKADSRR